MKKKFLLLIIIIFIEKGKELMYKKITMNKFF